jgi:hypothetical protein
MPETPPRNTFRALMNLSQHNDYKRLTKYPLDTAFSERNLIIDLLVFQSIKRFLISRKNQQIGQNWFVLLQTEMEKPEGWATEWARQWSPTWKHPAATTPPNKK